MRDAQAELDCPGDPPGARRSVFKSSHFEALNAEKSLVTRSDFKPSDHYFMADGCVLREQLNYKK